MQGASDLIPNPKQGKNSRGVFHETAGDCRRLGKGSFKIKKKAVQSYLNLSLILSRLKRIGTFHSLFF